ncbi:MAG: hypothetical protein RL083_1002 [Pseudomonadota bacterium]
MSQLQLDQAHLRSWVLGDVHGLLQLLERNNE